MERHTDIARQQKVRTYGFSHQQAGAPEQATTEAVTQAPPDFCSPEYNQAGAQALASFLQMPPNSDPSEVNREAQARKLFLLRPQNSDPRDVNDAWRKAPEAQRQAMLAQMPTLFPVVQPQLPSEARTFIVPGGLHSLNMVRIRALVAALQRLRETYGDESLQQVHIYFVGGRDLWPQEHQAVDQVMAAGLDYYCQAQWAMLNQGSKEDFLRHFVDAQVNALGAEGLQLPAVADTKLREKDSMKQIWTQSPGLEALRGLIPPENVHFTESRTRVLGKDNTHGNARQVMDKCLQHKTLEPGQAQVAVVCSDPYCLPRVLKTFDGYFEQGGWSVVGFSASTSGESTKLQEGANEAFVVLGLRETVCGLNEEQEKSRDAGNWFYCEDILGKHLDKQ